MKQICIILCLFLLNCNSTGKTASKKKVDLLEIYGEKPKNLEFIGNSEPGIQQIVISTYRVKSKYAKEVESFLTAKYNMPALKFICCNYHHGGYGEIPSDIIKTKYGEYASMSIHMYSDEIDFSKDYDNDYERAEYFYVTVEIVVV